MVAVMVAVMLSMVQVIVTAVAQWRVWPALDYECCLCGRLSDSVCGGVGQPGELTHWEPGGGRGVSDSQLPRLLTGPEGEEMHHAGQPPDISLRPWAGEAERLVKTGRCVFLGKMMCCLGSNKHKKLLMEQLVTGQVSAGEASSYIQHFYFILCWYFYNIRWDSQPRNRAEESRRAGQKRGQVWVSIYLLWSPVQ